MEGYEVIMRAVDVISRYALACPVYKPTAVNTGKVIKDILTTHAPIYLDSSQQTKEAFSFPKLYLK